MKILKKHYKISDAIQVAPQRLVYVDQLIMKLETIQGAFMFVLAKEELSESAKTLNLRAMLTVCSCLQEVITTLECGLYGYDKNQNRL